MQPVTVPARFGHLRSRVASLPPWVAPAGVAVGMAAAAAFAALVPPHGQGFYPRCPLYEATGVLCPGCGATRAVSALSSGHLGAALHDNLLLVVAVPLLVVAWAAWLARRAGATGQLGRLARLRWPRVTPAAIAVAMAVFAVARNIPAAPFRALVPLG